MERRHVYACGRMKEETDEKGSGIGKISRTHFTVMGKKNKKSWLRVANRADEV